MVDDDKRGSKGNEFRRVRVGGPVYVNDDKKHTIAIADKFRCLFARNKCFFRIVFVVFK